MLCVSVCLYIHERKTDSVYAGCIVSIVACAQGVVCRMSLAGNQTPGL